MESLNAIGATKQNAKVYRQRHDSDGGYFSYGRHLQYSEQQSLQNNGYAPGYTLSHYYRCEHMA
jgi:hypothetical protein